MNSDPILRELIVKAVVALNFGEPHKATDILLEALTELNFKNGKDSSHGNPVAAA
jgi:hypothetical protein